MTLPVEPLPKHCHWARAPKAGLHHVPGCMGAAVAGDLVRGARLKSARQIGNIARKLIVALLATITERW